MAGEVVPEVVPDWRDVRTQAEALFERTKDLRVAVHLANAVFALEGFTGLRDGLSLIAGLLEGYWETVHPQLDADDDDDPTFRVNAVQELSAEASQHTDACTMLMTSPTTRPTPSIGEAISNAVVSALRNRSRADSGDMANDL